VDKTIKYNVAFSDAGEKGTFDSVLNLKWFIQAVKIHWLTQKLLWPSNFPSFSCGPSETWCRTLGGFMAHVKNHCYIWHSLDCMCNILSSMSLRDVDWLIYRKVLSLSLWAWQLWQDHYLTLSPTRNLESIFSLQFN
jgi:hypothetical protein